MNKQRKFIIDDTVQIGLYYFDYVKYPPADEKNFTLLTGVVTEYDEELRHMVIEVFSPSKRTIFVEGGDIRLLTLIDPAPCTHDTPTREAWFVT